MHNKTGFSDKNLGLHRKGRPRSEASRKARIYQSKWRMAKFSSGRRDRPNILSFEVLAISFVTKDNAVMDVVV